ncbi:VOC family protein [Streptomyces sp. VRA16 Mangrove soil]|uniref:VOC family protein n=1 Tax=Streptomyces sp. VRA16 Mangrove soil TaxID=2817434 RepID=UPI001A9F8324|nr:VOC family protein [Streptomyces sp. VRA16 Mangrove soil]MBO1335454.1 VOC family protein [Streptomyces sp. VRA16 Mangrove soil]
MNDISIRMDAIGVGTSDLAASLAFYRLLGLVFPDGAEQLPHVETAPADGIRLMFDPDGDAADRGRGRIALAFHCSDAAGVDAAYEKVTAAGHHGESEPFDAPWGQRYAVVHDPDGNQVDLFA